MNAAIHATASQEASICSVDDAINRQSCDVAPFYRDIDAGLIHCEISKPLVTISRRIKIVMVLTKVYVYAGD